MKNNIVNSLSIKLILVCTVIEWTGEFPMVVKIIRLLDNGSDHPQPKEVVWNIYSIH